jgi:predicted DNA-binding transcriptional regulator YafY
LHLKVLSFYIEKVSLYFYCMNRIDRLHAILTHLQSKKLVKAQEIADRFNISLRTVYRDVKALEESGVPVIGEAGSGYSIMEGYRLPPLMFTQEEAAALLLAGKLAAHQTDASVHKQLDEAMMKIKAVLRTADKEEMNELSSRIEIINTFQQKPEEHVQHLTALQKAIAGNKVLFIRYESSYSKTELTERLIEPIGLLYYSNAWHLIAWCRLRNDYRDFKVNRISRLQLKEEVFNNSHHKSLQQYLETVRRNYELTEAVIKVDTDILKYMDTNKYYYGFVRQEQQGTVTQMHFLISHPEPFARWLLMFTNSVEIMEPALLQTFMEELSDELKEHYLK